MPKESNNPTLEDSLDKAGENISVVSDQQLAESFIEANELSLNSEEAPVLELFKEHQHVYEDEDLPPSPDLLKDLDESLSIKDVHHKKLLGEGEINSLFYRLFRKIKSIFNVPVRRVNKVSIISRESRIFSFFLSYFWKDTKSFLSNFGSLTDLWLRNDKSRISLMKKEFFIMLLFIVILSPVINIFSSQNPSLAVSIGWVRFILTSSIIALLLSIVPVFFFISLWFVNVNHLHTSRNFHFLLFFSHTLSFIFGFLSVFNACLYEILDLVFNL